MFAAGDRYVSEAYEMPAFAKYVGCSIPTVPTAAKMYMQVCRFHGDKDVNKMDSGDKIGQYSWGGQFQFNNGRDVNGVLRACQYGLNYFPRPAVRIPVSASHTPAALWNFEEIFFDVASGNDTSYRGKTVTSAGNPTYAQNIGAGWGKAVALDGVGDCFTIANADALQIGTEDFSIAALITLTTAPGVGTHARLIDFRADAGADGVGWSMGIVGASAACEIELILEDADSTTTFTTNGGADLTDGQTYLIVWTVDRDSATGVKCYINGVSEALDATDCTGEALTLNVATRDLTIGGTSKAAPDLLFVENIGYARYDVGHIWTPKQAREQYETLWSRVHDEAGAAWDILVAAGTAGGYCDLTPIRAHGNLVRFECENAQVIPATDELDFWLYMKS